MTVLERDTSMRNAFLIMFLTVSGVFVAGSQSSEFMIEDQLRQLFPSGTAFSSKQGNPAHFKIYRQNEDNETDPVLIGFAFYTTDLEPLERGYDGPIQVLVGLDTTGVITRIIVIDHNEPYGYFSVDRPEFAVQFISKSIRERFRVSEDVDAVSTATLTVTSATRAIRNAARRIARQFLSPEDVK